MDYPVELLPNRAECQLILDDTQADIERAQFRLSAARRSNTLQTDQATKDANRINALNDQIGSREDRIATMAPSDARLHEEIELRKLKREREELQDEQLAGQGTRGAFRRRRELDVAQRQLDGYLDCQAKVQIRHDSLPA